MSDQINVISKFVTLKTSEGYAFIDPDEIIHLKAEGNYTRIFVTGKLKPLRVLCQLSKMGNQLNNACFFRCHRSHIVNLKHLTGFMGKARILVFNGDHQVPISEYYLKDFRKLLT